MTASKTAIERAATPMLKIQNLTKRFDTPQGSRLALDHLNLNLNPGEVYGLLGPNGAGKSTTINMICNLLQPDEGSVEIAGLPVSDATKPLVGVTPQENLVYPSLTCAENLNFFARIYGLSKQERLRRVDRCLGLVNLGDRATSPAETLSGGMRRRLSMAISLIHQPKLVILDEPTTGLDIEARYEIWELIRLLQSEGVTVLLTTHLLEEAERLCQRIGIIRQGQLLAEGSQAELRRWVKAEQIAVVETSQENHKAAAIARAQSFGYGIRHYGSDLAFWLPKTLDLRAFLDQFNGIDLVGAALHPVRLEHIYLEITRLDAGA